jgi:hypothetical protein
LARLYVINTWSASYVAYKSNKSVHQAKESRLVFPVHDEI